MINLENTWVWFNFNDAIYFGYVENYYKMNGNLKYDIMVKIYQSENNSKFSKLECIQQKNILDVIR